MGESTLVRQGCWPREALEELEQASSSLEVVKMLVMPVSPLLALPYS